MHVLARIVDGDRPVAPARGDDADLAGEGHEPLGDGGCAVQGGERGFGILRPRHAGLPLAIIAEATGLQDRGRAGRGEGGGKVDGSVDVHEGCRLQP
jgi:hypothetical protein